MLTALAFIILAVVHLLPVAPAFSADALVRLYGVAADDTSLMVLLRHRAVLLAIVGVLSAWAAVSPSTRPAVALTRKDRALEIVDSKQTVLVTGYDELVSQRVLAVLRALKVTRKCTIRVDNDRIDFWKID